MVFDSKIYTSYEQKKGPTELESLRIYGFKQHLVRARQKRSELHSSVYISYQYPFQTTLSREHNISGMRIFRIVL